MGHLKFILGLFRFILMYFSVLRPGSSNFLGFWRKNPRILTLGALGGRRPTRSIEKICKNPLKIM